MQSATEERWLELLDSRTVSRCVPHKLSLGPRCNRRILRETRIYYSTARVRAPFSLRSATDGEGRG